MDKFIGKRLDGRYEIKELIGIGGMAIVYKAYDTIDDRTVAIKILKEEFLANEEFCRRFKNESKAISVLSHPNIVKVYDVSFGDVLQYIVMEYVDGITLKQYIEQQKAIGWKDSIHFISQILKALEHAHDKGIVHRDIKPQNILLLPNGSIKVTDFGIARFSRSEQRTITDKAIGSVHYISPEQARGDFTDEKADIYSVGVLLYEMITGQVPFQADSAVSVAIMQLQNDPVKPSEINQMIPLGLEEITLKAMQKDPANRYRSASAMLADIESFRLDPSVVFGYFFNSNDTDTQATKYVPDLPRTAEPPEKEQPEEKTKAPVVPILAGIAVAFIVIMGIAVFFAWNMLNHTGSSLTCPDLVGKKFEEIKNDPAYSKYNLVVTADNWQNNDDYDYGVIYKQSPEKGKEIKEKSDITLWVSLGPQEVKLDNYVGEEAQRATEVLKSLGLNNIKVVELANEEVMKGYIIKTVPEANAYVNAKTEIILYVSSGEDIVNLPVPDVTKMTKDEAIKKIEASGFTVGNISERYDSDIPAGIVISQSPSKNSNEVKNSPIYLTVSLGPAPATTTPPISKYTAKVKVDLPKINTIVSFTVWMDGVCYHTVEKMDLNTASSYSFDIQGPDESKTVQIRLNNVKYCDYTVDFKNNTYILKTKYDIGSLTPPNTSGAEN